MDEFAPPSPGGIDTQGQRLPDVAGGLPHTPETARADSLGQPSGVTDTEVRDDISASAEISANRGLRDRVAGLAGKAARLYSGDWKGPRLAGSSGEVFGRLQIKAMEALGNRHVRRAAAIGAGVVAVAGGIRYGTDFVQTLQGAGDQVTDDVASRPRTGITHELISSHRPASGAGSDIVAHAPTPSGGSTELQGLANTQENSAGMGNPALSTGDTVARDTVELNDAVESAGSDIRSEHSSTGNELADTGNVALESHTPIGIETDGHGNYTTTLADRWTGEPTELSGYYHKGSLDGRVADILIENGVDREYVNSHPSEVHQISLDILENSGLAESDQYRISPDQQLTIKPETLKHMHQHFGDAGLDLDLPGAEDVGIEMPSGEDQTAEPPQAENPPERDSDGGRNIIPPESDEKGLDRWLDEHIDTDTLVAAGGGALVGGAVVARRRAGNTARAAANGNNIADPNALAELARWQQDALRPLQGRIDQLAQGLNALQQERDDLENERDQLRAERERREQQERDEEEAWQERNGQIDVAGELHGNIEELNDPNNPYRQGLITGAALAATSSPHTGVTNPAELQHEGEIWVDHVWGASRPTGTVDAQGNPVDRRAEHLHNMYDGIRMTEADGTTVIDAPDAIDNPDQLVVPVGPDGRILPQFLTSLTNIMRDYRIHNRQTNTPYNADLLRMVGDENYDMETEIPWRNWLVAIGARFVRGEETT